MRALSALIILMTLALPLAAASPVDDTGNFVLTQVEVAYAGAISTLQQTFPPTDPNSDAPDEEARDEDPAAAGSPPPAAESQPRQAPPSPRRIEGLTGALPAPVSRLVPVPVTGAVGALPRIDLAQIARNLDAAAPLAPAPASATRPAPAPPESLSLASSAMSPVPADISPALVVAGVLATAGAAGASSGATGLWDRLRRLGFLGAILYSRIAKERLLDHGSRESLLDTIRARPGLALADLAQVTTIPRNTVTYHVRVLEREGLVSSTRKGRNRLFFAPGALAARVSATTGVAPNAISRDEVVAAFGTLRHQTTLAVARVIGETPGVDQKALCGSLGISASLAHWHADRLVHSGVVEKRREGRSVRYYPGVSFELVAARSA